MKARKFNLTAAILSTIGNSLMIILGIVEIIGLATLMSAGGGYLTGGAWVLVGLMLVVSISGLVLSSLTFSLTLAPNNVYLQRKGRSIGAIVLGTLNAILALVFFIISLSSAVGLAIFTLIIFILLATGVAFYITDLSLSLGKIESENAGQANETKLESVNDNQSNTKTIQSKDETKELMSIEKKLLKLKELKDTGVIDEDEYKAMKTKTINEEIK